MDVFIMSGDPNFWIASFSASTQKPASSVFDIRHAGSVAKFGDTSKN
jgi:hypothetical protein